MFMIKYAINKCNIINLMIRVGMQVIKFYMINGLIVLQMCFKK
jgi:hypothetical protein